MRKSISRSVLVSAACLLAVQPLSAQRQGPGGIIDWIHRLSGPSMLGFSGSYFWEFEEDGPRFRFEGALRFPVAREDRIGDDHKLNMFSFQPSVEIPIRGGPFEVKTGVNINRFGGKGHDPVWHLTVPLYGQLRFAVDNEQNLFLRLAAGVHYFPAFGYNDFDGEIMVNREEGEGTLALLLGLDFMR